MKHIQALPIESQESSSPIVTRAVAAALRGDYLSNYSLPTWQKQALMGLGLLPQSLGRMVVKWQQSITGLDPASLYNLNINQLAQGRLADYEGLEKPFSSLLIGVPQGGATAHLAMALGSPFLPEAFVLTLRGGSMDGDVKKYFQRSAALALHIAANNPEVLTIQHYDPVHDGWLIRRVNHLRLKLLTLPEAYKDFIKKSLRLGGKLLYIGGCASWLRFRVGEHSVFQVGGWGDISAEEFVGGSRRIQMIGQKEGFKTFQWRLPGFPIERGAESEWGSEPEFCNSLQAFCSQEGYQFQPLQMAHPNDYSRLAFHAVRQLFDKAGIHPSGTLVEMFTQFDALAPFRCGLLPLWLVFNTQDSLNFLREMTPQFPIDRPVFFSPLSTFSMTPDLTSWREWEEALKGFNWQNIGTRPSHYPTDTRTVASWQEQFQAWCKEHEIQPPGHLSVEEIVNLAHQFLDPVD